VPVVVFTLWSGEGIINAVLSPDTAPSGVPSDPVSLTELALFITLFYLAIIVLAGYLVAADSGRRGMIALWIDILVFVLVPLFLIIPFGLILGLTLCAVVWTVYFYVRNRLQQTRHLTSPPPLDTIAIIGAEQRATLMSRATMGSFWFATAFALVSLIVDGVYELTGGLPRMVLIWVLLRTLLLPVLGYLLGRLGGSIAVRRTLMTNNGTRSTGERMRKKRALEVLSPARAREEVKDIVPTDLPLRSKGAQRFYLLLLAAFILFYPVLDPYLFGPGTDGRLAGFGDAGRYVILALGLNIVVGFAGLLDLGYVAFFAIGSYAWGLVGSTQFTVLTGIAINTHSWSWLFWPMVIIAALVTALFGVVLGVPTLRLRGDYLAIVTLGFGEIIPIFFLELDKYTNGTNGIVGVYSPAFPGVNWSTSTPYYYLVLALIAVTIFANLRLRDSRLGRAWIAIREDEIAAASSGINLVRTKLFAFAAGAFFSGIAGVYFAAKLGSVFPDFSFSDSVIYLAMVVIGGLGSIPGVIVGALGVYAINEFVLTQLDTLSADPNNVIFYIHAGIVHILPGFTFGNIRNLVFGLILIIVMIFRPEGLIPSARRQRELRATTTDDMQISSLDATPGAPGFESEVHVE
jgi:ABC-type branched-subunit amino acid transport system permease subunit